MIKKWLSFLKYLVAPPLYYKQSDGGISSVSYFEIYLVVGDTIVERDNWGGYVGDVTYGS